MTLHPRQAGFCLTTVLVTLYTVATARAQIHKLSDLAYSGYSMDSESVVVTTTGHAKLRLSFISDSTVRVEIAPTGDFTKNNSPAVLGLPAAVQPEVSVSDDVLLIQTKGLSLRLDKKHLRVDAYDAKNSQPISLESQTDGTTWDTNTGAIHQSRVLSDGEHLYGLGQDNANKGTLDRRGTIREMWTGQQIRSGNVTADYPIPFYLSTGTGGRGYGCFVDNSWRMKFDLGKSQKDRLSWAAPGGPIDYYLFNGPSFKKIVDQYTRLTGRPSMLPLWAFGFWQSRCFFQSFPDIQHSASRIQSDGIPIDVVVVDSAWSRQDMDFKWSDNFLQGRTASDWISAFHAEGLKVILSTKGPMMTTKCEQYAQAMSLGLFASDGSGKPMTAGYYGGDLMDFTSPNMLPWLTTQLKPLTQDGIDGWWLDLNEPEGEPPQAVYHAGKSADIHNTFSLRNYKAYYDYCLDVEPDRRPVILGRAATAGTQRYSSIVWTGDINSDWPTFRAHLPELQNAGLSGLPYWTNDSGGFLSGFLNNDRYGAHAQLYERWFEFTCFAPIARAHKAGPSEPYEYGPVVEASARKYLQLRYRLMPYIYNLAHEAAISGLPMVRPLILDYQDDPGSATAKTEYLMGDDLLVAPIIWADATSRPVYFPPGKWISLEDGYEVDGGTTVVVAAPHDRLPLFVKAGAILPQAPEMTHTSEKPWDPVTLEIWPQGESTAALYQDDDATNAFEHGESTSTTLTCSQEPGQSVLLKIDPSNTKFGPRQWIAKFHLTSVPKSVAVNHQPLDQHDWTWDQATRLLTVTFPGERKSIQLQVALDGSVLARATAPHLEMPVLNDDSVQQKPKQIAQFLPPPKLPIQIEAANFDKGGEGLAFHLSNAGNPSGLYRTDGVPLVSSSDTGGGYAVSGITPGDWLAYTIDAGNGGWFEISVRVMPGPQDGSMSLLRGRDQPLTTLHLTGQTVGDSHWATATGGTMFQLPAGEQFLTLRLDKGGAQLGKITFSKASHPPAERAR